MNIFHISLLLQIVFNILTLIPAQWCVNFKSVIKSRIQWNNGQRLVSKRNFFGVIKYKYEPYVYSTVQTFHDYERVNVCCDGYTAISDSKCEPVCNPTCPNNTHCIRPNICECNMGYRGYTNNAIHIQCEPFCKPTCTQNSECIEPNKCSCNKGYEDANGNGICQPICENACPENSSCITPNECTCNAGYLRNDLGQCKPVCNPKCPEYGECALPNTCTCQANYIMENGTCVPICEQECPQHAQCISLNECQCRDGYVAIEQLNTTNITCIPKCDKGCPAFANCTHPNFCECQPGYRANDKNVCEPICENGCPAHSNCSKANTCICEKGYVMLDEQCQPMCDKACPEHAYCSEPNKCMCESGYQLKLSSIYNLYCEPVCQRNCSSFGKCVQPNKCECLYGYEMDEMEQCQPVCTGGCKYGLCFQAEVCICNPGYLMGPKGECEAVCSMPCQNGSCIEPEICQCHEGFKLQTNSINVCEAICDPHCINGICVAPNVCICHENYEPIKTDVGLNHNHCALLGVSTAPTTTAKYLKQEVTTATPNTILEISSSLHPDLLRRTSLRTSISAEICNANCECWQEFDEFGPLVTNKCKNLCMDAFDKPCLDLKLCQCDLAKTQLVCRASEDELVSDDPILYTCNIYRRKATTLNSGGESISSDMKSVRPAEKSNFLWGWLIIIVALTTLCILGILLFVYFRNVEEPIMEYEL